MDIVKHEVVSIYDLMPHEANYNKHPQSQLDRLKASLRRFKQVEFVVVKALSGGKYQIVAHEGVITAALQLLESGECPHLAQCNVIVVPDSWDEVEIKGYMTASNETARLSSPDDELLVQLLQEQQDAGFDLASLGSSDESLREMLEALGDVYLGGDEERTRTTELNEPEGGEVESSYNVLIECTSEAEQKRAYEMAEREGFACKVLTL